MDFVDKLFLLGIKVVVLIFIIIGFICACEAHGKTWDIADGKYKTIYDNREDCIRANSGTKTTERCYDNNSVIYKNK